MQQNGRRQPFFKNAYLVDRLMQIAQREVQDAGLVYPASVRLDGSEIGRLNNKHGYARGEHCQCGDRHDAPSQS
jgi:hypothetical protein